MNLSHKSYSEIKSLSIERQLTNIPVSQLLSKLSSASAEMCSDNNPNVTGSLLISRSNFSRTIGTPSQHLGSGTYGDVYKTVRGHAVKLSKLTFLSSDLREIAILNYLSHPNVVCLFAVKFGAVNSLSVGMPLAIGNMATMDLSDIDMRKFIYYQLFRGLAYIHSKSVVHLDIKPENVLIFEEQSAASPETTIVPKIADFGFSLAYAQTDIYKGQHVGSRWWRAPEQFFLFEFDETVDVWALGAMLLSSVIGKPAFKSKTDRDGITAIFDTLGAPAPEDWQQENLDKYIDAITGFPTTSFKGTLSDFINSNIATIDADEFDVISKTVTWPSVRLRATDVLNLPYFTGNVITEVEKIIPADPVVISPCGEQMFSEQVSLTAPVIPKEQAQKYLDKMMYANFSINPATHQAYFYSATFAAIHIAKYGDYNDDIGEAIVAISNAFMYKNDKTALAHYKNIQPVIQDLLVKHDFKLVFPTCFDFALKYLDTTTAEYLDLRQKLMQLMYTIYNVFAFELDASVIAQIAIVTSGFKNILCFSDKVYTSEIYDTLAKTNAGKLFQPPSGYIPPVVPQPTIAPPPGL